MAISYGVYATLAIAFPSVALGIAALLIPAVLGLFLMFFHSKACHRLPGLIGKIVIAEFQEEEIGRRKFKYFICGQKINTCAVASIACVTVLEFLCAAVAFWNTFLVDSALDQCADNSWDCFPLDRINGSLLEGFEISLDPENCSQFQEDGNITVLCFQFVFAYAEGLSEAGGLVFALSLGINLYIGLFVFLNRIKSQFRRRMCRFLVGSCGVATFCLPFLLFTFVEGRETIRTPQRAVQFSLYMVTLFFVVFVLGVSMCVYIPHFDEEEARRRRNNTIVYGEMDASEMALPSPDSQLDLQTSYI